VLRLCARHCFQHLAQSARLMRPEASSWKYSPSEHRGERGWLLSRFSMFTSTSIPAVEVLNAAITGGGGSAARPVPLNVLAEEFVTRMDLPDVGWITCRQASLQLRSRHSPLSE
jgi:hypothetical protein